MADESEHSASRVDYTYQEEEDQEQYAASESPTESPLGRQPVGDEEYADSEFDQPAAPEPEVKPTPGDVAADTESAYSHHESAYQRALQEGGFGSPEAAHHPPPSTNYHHPPGDADEPASDDGRPEQPDAGATLADGHQQDGEPSTSGAHSSRSSSFEPAGYEVENALSLGASDFAIYAQQTQMEHEARRIAAAAGHPIPPILAHPTRGRKQTVAPIPAPSASSFSQSSGPPAKPAFSGSTFFGSGVKHNQWPQSSTDAVTAQQQKKVKKLPRLEPSNSRHIFAGGTLDFSAAAEEKNEATFMPGGKKPLQLSREMLAAMTTPLANPILYEPRLAGPMLAASASAPKLGSTQAAASRAGGRKGAAVTSTATLSRPDPNIRVEDVISLKDQLHAEKRKVSAQDRLLVQFKTELQRVKADSKRKDRELIHVLSRKIGEGADTPAGGLQLIKSERLLIAGMVEKLADLENKLEVAEEARAVAEKASSETAHRLQTAQQSSTFFEAEAKRLVDLLAKAKAHRDLGKYLSAANGELVKPMSPSQGGAGAVPSKESEATNSAAAAAAGSSGASPPAASLAGSSSSLLTPSLTLVGDPSVHQTLVEFHQRENRTLLGQNKELKEEVQRLRKASARYHQHEVDLARHLKESRQLIQLTFVENEGLRQELQRAQSALKAQSSEMRAMDARLTESAKETGALVHQRNKAMKDLQQTASQLYNKKEDYLKLATAYRSIGGKYGGASGLSLLPSDDWDQQQQQGASATTKSASSSRTHSVSPARPPASESPPITGSTPAAPANKPVASAASTLKADVRPTSAASSTSPAKESPRSSGRPTKESPRPAAKLVQEAPVTESSRIIVTPAQDPPRPHVAPAKESPRPVVQPPTAVSKPTTAAPPATQPAVATGASDEEYDEDYAGDSDYVKEEPAAGKPLEVAEEEPDSYEEEELEEVPDVFAAATPATATPAATKETAKPKPAEPTQPKPSDPAPATNPTATSAGVVPPKEEAAPATSKETPTLSPKPTTKEEAPPATETKATEKPKSAGPKPMDKSVQPKPVVSAFDSASGVGTPRVSSSLTVAVSTVPSRPMTPQRPLVEVIPPLAPIAAAQCDTCTGGAVVQCVDCESPFCQACFADLHKSSKLATHKAVLLDDEGKAPTEEAKPEAAEPAADPKAIAVEEGQDKAEETPTAAKPTVDRTQSIADVLASKPKKKAQSVFDQLQSSAGSVSSESVAPLCAECHSELASVQCVDCRPVLLACPTCDAEVHQPKALRQHARKPMTKAINEGDQQEPGQKEEEEEEYADDAVDDDADDSSPTAVAADRPRAAQPGTIFVMKTADPEVSLLCEKCNELTAVLHCPTCRSGRQRLCAECDTDRHADGGKYAHHTRTPVGMDVAKQTRSPIMRSSIRADLPSLDEPKPSAAPAPAQKKLRPASAARNQPRANLAAEARADLDAQHSAATKIQAIQRGRAVRLQKKQQPSVGGLPTVSESATAAPDLDAHHRAATKIQSIQRGRSVRSQAKRKQGATTLPKVGAPAPGTPAADLATQNRAATKVQAMQRGRSVRQKKKANLLLPAAAAATSSATSAAPRPSGLDVQHQAAAKIQAIQRGRAVRQQKRDGLLTPLVTRQQQQAHVELTGSPDPSPTSSSAAAAEDEMVVALHERKKTPTVIVRASSLDAPEGEPTDADSPSSALAPTRGDLRSSRSQPHDSGGLHSVGGGLASPPSPNYRPSSRTPSAPPSPHCAPMPAPRPVSRSKSYRAGSPGPGPSSRVPREDGELEPLAVQGAVLAAAVSPLQKPNSHRTAVSPPDLPPPTGNRPATKEQLGGDLGESSSDEYSSDDD